ncbi:MAG: flavin-containing monooxygenase [Solirubrobacteraceae bacterium]
MRTTTTDHVDVLIVGAGLSGIGAACHLARDCPDRSFTILEARDEIGGTWDLFRYPGVRSDSDMQTLGYAFAPWKDDQVIADGASILRYVRQTAAKYRVDERIRPRHRARSAAWDSAESAWTVQVQRTDTAETLELSCSFLLMCTGYYRYDGGYTPEFPGTERFAGPIIHPQAWPEDLDYAGKRVAVIGSGATAITLLPALARAAAHVTMLQRSPSYVVSLPAVDPLARWARRWLPEMAAYQLIRSKNVLLMGLSYQLSRRRPKLVKASIRRMTRRQLPEGFDVDTHFRPRYDPWDERMCVCPDGDLFRALSSGRASVVTDTIETFTEHGIALTSGQELAADIIVTATGLRLQALGGASLSVDGQPVQLPDKLAYRGMMLSGVPNFALTIGYTNASWTLKADLVADYVCRLLNHMRAHGYRECVAPDDPPGVQREPLIDLSSGYVQRSVRDFPQQGSELPWRVRQNYALDRRDFRRGGVDDGVMQFSRGALATGPEGTVYVAA